MGVALNSAAERIRGFSGGVGAIPVVFVPVIEEAVRALLQCVRDKLINKAAENPSDPEAVRAAAVEELDERPRLSELRIRIELRQAARARGERLRGEALDSAVENTVAELARASAPEFASCCAEVL